MLQSLFTPLRIQTDFKIFLKKVRFTETQIVGVLGVPKRQCVTDICREQPKNWKKVKYNIV